MKGWTEGRTGRRRAYMLRMDEKKDSWSMQTDERRHRQESRETADLNVHVFACVNVCVCLSLSACVREIQLTLSFL